MDQTTVSRRLIGVTFTAEQKANVVVWAPRANQVAITVNGDTHTLPLTSDDTGYWTVTTDQLKPGDLYSFVIDGEKEYADPASLAQPQGVYGPSQAFDTRTFYWEESCWVNPPLDEYILYELDTYTFTPEGTFKAVVNKLGYLKSLGINAIVIRPVTPFPDSRNWSSDGVFLYAVQASYGGPAQLQQLINACHVKGIAVIMDLAYNQLDGHGNSFSDCRTYPSRRQSHQHPSKPTHANEAQQEAGRRYLVENALMWFRDFHVDALRLNAAHTLPESERLLKEIRQQTNTLSASTGRHHYLLIENGVNLTSAVEADEPASQPMQVLGHEGYSTYCVEHELSRHLTKTYREDYIYDEPFSTVLRDLFDRQTEPVSGSPFVLFSQPHERMPTAGDCSGQPISLDLLKLMAGSIMVSPYIPTLFMGEEWGVTNPFDLAQPESSETGTDSHPALPWDMLDQQPNKMLFDYYQTLTALRRQQPALHHLNPREIDVIQHKEQQTMLLHRWHGASDIICLLNFSAEPQSITIPVLNKTWCKLLDSADPRWSGPAASPDDLSDAETLTLQPESIVVYKAQ
ncbi:alpha-amylase family glycosyl hydrolase [Spirosoma rigui]|uniref:alpha-amylase family glycosyl hydrolase n=1 Tax=Spirosoma rigui TaxID=564064 RepID=UPI0009B020E0|nr:alpha-amylase family glycosyl hydrolase [Spirosoma rigui]